MKKQFLWMASLAFVLILEACSAPAATPLRATPSLLTVPPALTSALPIPSTTSAPASPSPSSTAVAAPTFPNSSNYQWRQVVSGLRSPVNLANAGDGSGRVFVLEKKGFIRVVSGGQLQSAPFLDISDRVGSQGSEQGLLGLAFHPDFKTNGYLYVDYTNVSGNTVIARFAVDPSLKPADQKADPASEKILLTIDQPFANHNGGHMVFGPDGMLWIGMGDGGSAGDPKGNAQSLQTLLGKLLRIDINNGDPYAIPKDNPFAAGGGLPEIWAYGLRNPWQFSFDALTKDLYIADVGQDQWEEIDFLPASFSAVPANFGWNVKEGSHPYKESATPPSNLIDPIYEYSHSLGCSIIGANVYRGKALPEFNGIYLYGDYCAGTVWGLIRSASGGWQNQTLFETGLKINAFGTDESGEIYFVTSQGGLYRLEKK